MLQAHGYLGRYGRPFTRGRISQIRIRMRDFANAVILDSSKIEDQIRSSSTLLRMAAQTDPRARQSYHLYQDELLRTGCPTAAFAKVKKEAQEEHAGRKAAEVKAEAAEVVQVVDIHSNGKIG